MRTHTGTIPQLKNGRANPFSRHRSSPIIRYILATVSVFVAMSLTDRLRDTFQGTPNALFFCAIIFSSWFGGFGPGIFASVLSIMAIKFCFTPPFYSFAFALGEIPRFGVFLISGAFISWLGD